VLKKIIYRPFSAALILWIATITGCATTGPGISPQKTAPPPAKMALSQGWWSARFRMYWPQEEEPSWHIDLLLAHQIIAPVLEQYKDSIRLWRFHRRAARDEAGHQFSFIFYASAETAYHIFDTLRSDALLKEMKLTGAIIADIYDNPDLIAKPRIGDTSDPNWPSSIQSSWPYFIMGASRMWLNLIAATVADMPNPNRPLALEKKVERFKKVNATITSLWEKQGRHAFLHHLNALFGYEPLIFYEKRMLKF
jgi:hypothetical protein